MGGTVRVKDEIRTEWELYLKGLVGPEAKTPAQSVALSIGYPDAAANLARVDLSDCGNGYFRDQRTQKETPHCCHQRVI
jgi:hypothetical protein